MEPQRTFLKDNSKKLLNKIILAAIYTPKEIEKLNTKYAYMNLYIKQVPVDKYGNELPSHNPSSNESSSSSIPFYNNFSMPGKTIKKKKRKQRKAAKSLKDFFTRYFKEGGEKEKKGEYYSSSSEIDNDYFSSRSQNKNGKKKSNGKSILKKRNGSSSITEKKRREIENNKICPKEQLMKYSKELSEAFHDCQSVKCKESNIEDEEFKKIIIRYINQFKYLLEEDEYNRLFDKWKGKYALAKNVDPSRISNANDLRNWKIYLLKGLKSEMVVKAASTLFAKVSGMENENENENNNNIINNGNIFDNNFNRKRNRDRDQGSSSESEENESGEDDNENNKGGDNNKRAEKERRIDNNMMQLERDRNQDSENDLDE